MSNAWIHPALILLGGAFVLPLVPARLKKTAPVAVRVNPDVEAHTHKKITTGTSSRAITVPLTESLPRPICSLESKVQSAEARTPPRSKRR